MNELDTLTQKIDKKTLAQFLSIHRSTLRNPEIFAELGLKKADLAYQWNNIFRGVLRTEGCNLPKHLSELISQHPHSRILRRIENLGLELTRPLLTFSEMAAVFGYPPDTLCKSLRQGRTVLPIRTIAIGPRMRRYCSLEAELWSLEQIALNLPKTSFPRLSDRHARRPALVKSAGSPPIQNVIFGVFGEQ